MLKNQFVDTCPTKKQLKWHTLSDPSTHTFTFVHTGGRRSRRCKPECRWSTCHHSTTRTSWRTARICYATTQWCSCWSQSIHRSSSGSQREHVAEHNRTDHIHTRYISNWPPFAVNQPLSTRGIKYKEIYEVIQKTLSSSTITSLTLKRASMTIELVVNCAEIVKN